MPSLDLYDSLTSPQLASPQPRRPGLVIDRMSFPTDRDLKTDYIEQKQMARSRGHHWLIPPQIFMENAI